jgi:hypothetical protein
MRRRHRSEYTPEQKRSRENLDRAEMWCNILSSGIGKSLEREYVCGGGMRMLMTFINGEFERSISDLEKAQDGHDKLFNRGAYRVKGRTGKNPKKKSPANKVV